MSLYYLHSQWQTLIVDKTKSSLCGTLKILVAVNELQIELEPIDLPAAIPFDEMKIIAAHEDPCVLISGVRQVMIGNAVAEHIGFVPFERYLVVSCLVMDGLDGLQPLVPHVHDLLWRLILRLASG
jgi:hypothetical protein